MGHWHGKRDTRIYAIWKSMRQRCNDTNCKGYARYGGRGISVCSEWSDFSTFYAWAMVSGYDETAARGECTLDRIDNDGNYSPDNCRWVNAKVQANNTRANRKLEYRGETKSIREWSEIVGISYGTLKRRTGLMGWSAEKALTTPVGRRKPRGT